jgi:Tol biopolymer transport system component
MEAVVNPVSWIRMMGFSRRLASPRALLAHLCILAAVSVVLRAGPAAQSGVPSTAAQQKEVRLRNLRQLTVRGENAEAYFSNDDKWLIFQGHDDPGSCDQIYVMDVQGAQRRLVSTGKGRTTCSYIFPGGKKILYSSTHLASPACPPKPDYSRGYVWPIEASYDIFTADWDGKNLRRLTTQPGYDAEATLSRDGKRIVFTSTRDGDLDLYSMNSDGSDVRRLTSEPGYDGGAFFSADGRQIVYRAHHPSDPKELEDYRALLKDGLIRPTKLELFVMNADGSNKRQITSFGAASFAPFFHPDGKRIIFSSNKDDPKGREFDLYIIGVDGKGLERVTYSEGFDGFPMFSSDGKKLVFGSNRNAAKQGDTNVFIADWVE